MLTCGTCTDGDSGPLNDERTDPALWRDTSRGIGTDTQSKGKRPSMQHLPRLRLCALQQPPTQAEGTARPAMCLRSPYYTRACCRRPRVEAVLVVAREHQAGGPTQRCDYACTAATLLVVRNGRSQPIKASTGQSCQVASYTCKRSRRISGPCRRPASPIMAAPNSNGWTAVNAPRPPMFQGPYPPGAQTAASPARQVKQACCS